MGRANSSFWPKSLVVIGTLAVVLSTAALWATSLASAYNNEGNTPCLFQYGGGSSTLTLKYRDDDYLPPTGAYATAFADAADDWDAAYTPADFEYDSNFNAGYFVSADFGDSGFLGKAKWYCNIFSNRTGTEDWLNEYYLDFEGQNFKQSVAGHELGHWIGARHSTVSPALMNTGRDRDTLYTVQEDDECAINDRYDSDWEVTC